MGTRGQCSAAVHPRRGVSGRRSWAVRSFVPGRDGIWRAKEDSSTLEFGAKSERALEFEEALARVPELSVSSHWWRHRRWYRMREGVEIYCPVRNRSQSAHFAVLPEARKENYSEKIWNGIYTAAGFMHGDFDSPKTFGKTANDDLLRKQIKSRETISSRAYYGSARFVKTRYGFVVPGSAYQFVQDYIHTGDLEGSFCRNYPGRRRKDVRERAKKQLMGDETTNALFISRVAEELDKDEDGHGWAARLINSMQESVERTLESSQPWRATEPAKFLIELGQMCDKAKIANWERLKGVIDVESEELIRSARTEQPSVAEIENAQAQGTPREREVSRLWGVN